MREKESNGRWWGEGLRAVRGKNGKGKDVIILQFQIKIPLSIFYITPT